MSPSHSTIESLESAWAALVALCLLLAVGALSLRTRLAPKDSETIHQLGGLPLLSAWLFFTQRYDFLIDTFKKTGQKMFRFRVLQYQVVALSGEDGRRFFFGERNLSMEEGFRILGGPTPNPRDINIDTMTDASVPFIKHVHTLLRKDRLENMLPELLKDTHQSMLRLGSRGRLNPFEDMYNLVFQMTVRMATCRELAEERSTVSRLLELFALHEKTSSPISLLFPWLPGRSKRTKEAATRELFDILARYVSLRRNAVEPSSDGIDLLMQAGYDDTTNISYTLGVIFAGVTNTGINVCWCLIYLGARPDWKDRITAEVQRLLSRYGNPLDPTHIQFAAVPLHAWEDEMPMLETFLKETMRFTMAGTALRRNVGTNIVIANSGKQIRPKDFIAYSLGDAHFDAEIYEDPFAFDPSRFEEQIRSPKAVYPFLGWGAGVLAFQPNNVALPCDLSAEQSHSYESCRALGATFETRAQRETSASAAREPSRLTNAERLARRLPLKPPTRRSSARRAAASAQAAARGYIQVFAVDNAGSLGTPLGFVSSGTLRGAQYTVVPGRDAALVVAQNGGGPGRAGELVTLNSDSPTPAYLGLVQGRDDTSSTLSAGRNVNYLYLASTEHTSPNGGPQNVRNSVNNAFGGRGLTSESVVWTTDSSTNVLSAQWTNPDGSRAPTVPFVQGAAIYFSGNPQAFQQAYPAPIRRIVLVFVPA
ncbi:unnamed protein product [Mycena citricolor]|uniref:Cytochrome P450 n=1 Tax=Mycena citricolor TaxID=2018698 RepID=A0AAD2HRE4_9AGAR|nr:unnamed protein product [Mycena citricolor]